ncbi:uncharacterized protein LOC120430783 isoform X2 [Culex pipiens pallens]|uniref:uncharacterized protein LOC120430783 isoform X2 n=1 Tax=Culex pipiens pallens TaxID=42434 RepID=UPI00195376D0|nr:uncharacterized protein LOC120430783 isoform X2 [Culex pipiens pallens]
MAEMSPSGGGGPPVPAVRTSSLQQPVPQSRPNATTTQAVVHHSATPQQQQQRNHQVYAQPPQQQHLQPQVILASGSPAVQQQQHSQATNNQILVTSSGLVSGPRLVVLHRHNGDFGFTLRHFIVYPPPDAHPPDPGADRLAAAAGMPNFAQPMDTVFVKKVHPNSPAFLAGLQEGDRLLAVNGLSVASLPYAQVVATIQQTPKTLTLQVVPKNYDLLQTYFSETAYNPETNQRPQPQQLFIPKASSTPTSHHRTSTGKRQVLTDVQEKQESLYSTLQEIVESAVAPTSNSSSNKPAAIYAEVPKIRSPPIAAEAPKPKPVVFDFDPIKQQQYLAQQQQQQKMLLQHSRDSDSISSYDSVKSAATLSANDVVLMGGGDSAIMSRLRKSFEQKEEFLRRPAPAPTSCASDVQQREFYGRPNRLQKSVWPPPPSNATMPVIANESNHQHQHHQQDSLLRPTTTKMSSGTQTHAASLAAAREQHSSAMSAIREQFFAGTNGEPKSAPPSLLLIQQNQQLSGSQSALPLSPASMHVVSEKAKLFESGRPLSPDGVDRAELYKSELSRMNPKQVVPNVAVRRKEFELKAESTGWRRSTEEKPRSVSSDSESRRTPVRVRSLSVESSGSKDPMASLYAASTASSDDQQHSLPTSAKDAPGSCSLLRQRPVRENSYRHAVRNSTAFWLQGPATAGSFVPPPSALSPPPSSAPPTHGHLSHFSFPTSSSSSPPSSLTLGIGTSTPVPPARTYAAAHRLQQPFSEEQFRLKLLHRNQTIVEVHSQPGGHDGEGPGGAGSGFDADVDMQLYTPPAPPLLSSSSSSSSYKPLSVVPEHGDGGGRAANVVVKSGGTAPMVAPVTTPVRPTTLNLCSDSNQVVLRQKQQHQQPLTIEEDERKTRRISYLRATAHDNLLHMMESSAEPSVDSSPMSLPPDTPDTEPEVACGSGGAGGDQLSLTNQQQQQQVVPQIQLQQQVSQQLKSAYRPWRRPRFNTDIQPLRRLFDESAPGGGGQGNLPPILESQQQPSTSKDNSEPTTPTTPTNRDFDDPSKFAAIVTDSDGEVGEEPAVAIRSAAGPRTAQKRSASLTTTTLGGAQLTGSSLGNLHVITTTSASGIVTRSYFFAQSHSAKSKALAHFRDAPADPSVAVTREGELNVKVTLIDGKRSQDRSWRTVHAELRGTRLRLTLLRDGKSSSSQSPEPSGIIDLTNFHVAEGNYTKRKNVFKLTTVSYQQQNFQQYPLQHQPPTSAQSHQHLALHHTQSSSGGLGGGTSSVAASSSSGGLYRGYERELLLQADSQHDMRLWMDSLRTVCRSSQHLASADYINNLGGQQAEPQRVAALTSVQSTTSTDEFSPVLSAKSHRKYALGSRSPSGQSPVTKSRKTPQQSSAAVSAPVPNSGGHHHQSSQHHSSSHSGKESSDKETGSPKSKTWKGIVARQFRKMQGQPGSPQNAEMLLPDGASINVPLPMCPPSDENPYVPLLLAKCTGIVESKGLSVTGIYRIPGNTAAITALTEQVNRGMDEITLRDPKWEDVNVVSSLLKLFIRNLPEPLLPNDLYNSFIAADRLSGQPRLIEIKALLARIPTYNYETLKHLMRHLYVVSMNAPVNLMDPRNLAIVFGPSVVRSANESLEAAVKDMKHQCQIVEVLVNHYTYFFEDDLLPAVEEKQSTSTVDSGLDVPSASLLLDNVSKIEPFKDSSKESSSHFVAQIVQAANRKIRRTTQRKSTMSSTTPDTLSLDSTTSAESKEQSSRSSHHHHRVTSSYLQQQIGPASLAALDRHSSSSPAAHTNDHQHFFGGRQQLGSSQSNDDASSVLNRSSEEDSNDSAFADNGSMSLKTVTIALDHKLRSLRNSSVDSDRDVADTGGGGGGGIGTPTGTGQDSDGSSSCCYNEQLQATPTRRSVHHSRPLTLGENIPYADESPERPLIQSRAKPLRQLSNSNANGNFVKPCTEKTNSSGNLGSNTLNNNSQADDSVRSAHSQKSLDSNGGGGGTGTTNSSTNDSCVTLMNDHLDDLDDLDANSDKVNNISISSDDTDTSTTSNPREKLTAAASTYRIDNEVLKKMNRILTNLERKANNLERKFNLNRSLSLNYKNHKNLECCCGHHHGVGAVVPGTNIPVQCCNNNNNNLQNHGNNNNNNSVSVNNSLNVRSRLSLTKDEKTDKNINRRRQIHDVSHTCVPAGPQIILTPAATTTASAQPSSGRHRRQMGNRSIRRRHTVGGTHDYSAGNAAVTAAGGKVQACPAGQGVCEGVTAGTAVGEDKGCKDLN